MGQPRRRRLMPQLFMLVVLLWSEAIWAAAYLEVRSYNPFTQIYGRPGFFDGSVSAGGSSRIRAILEAVSLTEIETRPGGDLELDGETYQLELAYDRVVGQALEVGIRIPVIHRTGGWMDDLLSEWHDLLGVPDGKRDVQPPDSLRLFFDDGQGERFLVDETGTGLGDIRLSARYRLTSPTSRRSLALHAGLKLPTGSVNALRGSGAVDGSLGIGLTDPVSLGRLRTTLSANAGVLFLGDGKVLSAYQHSAAAFGGVQAAVHLARGLSLIGGIQATSAYYDTDVKAIGDPAIALLLGGEYRTRNGWQFQLGIVEDGLSRTMPDFALHFGAARCLGRAC